MRKGCYWHDTSLRDGREWCQIKEKKEDSCVAVGFSCKESLVMNDYKDNEWWWK